jgi:molybdenum cofactor cytidylyltransferase
MNKKITAIILSGGSSSRMGSPKSLLEIQGKTFIDIIKEKIHASGINDIYIVLGSDPDYIINNLNKDNLEIIINKSWKNGQLSSLKAAVQKAGDKSDAVMMFLVDHPQVKLDTIRKLINVYNYEKAHIIIPEYNGRGGHPVIFSKETFAGILEAPLNEGAKAVVRDNRYKRIRIPVDDPYVLQDIDTPAEFKKIKHDTKKDTE